MALRDRGRVWVQLVAAALAIPAGMALFVLEAGELVALDRGDGDVLLAVLPAAAAAGAGAFAALLTGAVRQGIRELRGAGARPDVARVAAGALTYAGLCAAGCGLAFAAGGGLSALGFAIGYAIIALAGLPAFERTRRPGSDAPG